LYPQQRHNIISPYFCQVGFLGVIKKPKNQVFIRDSSFLQFILKIGKGKDRTIIFQTRNNNREFYPHLELSLGEITVRTRFRAAEAEL